MVAPGRAACGVAHRPFEREAAVDAAFEDIAVDEDHIRFGELGQSLVESFQWFPVSVQVADDYKALNGRIDFDFGGEAADLRPGSAGARGAGGIVIRRHLFQPRCQWHSQIRPRQIDVASVCAPRCQALRAVSHAA